MRLLLDTGVIGQICHPRKYQDVRRWFADAVDQHELLISEVADYEPAESSFGSAPRAA